MNKSERKLLGRIYSQLGEVAALNPPNPMDIRAVAFNLRTATKATSALRWAVWYVIDGTPEEAERELERAAELLKRTPEPSRFDHKPVKEADQ